MAVMYKQDRALTRAAQVITYATASVSVTGADYSVERAIVQALPANTQTAWVNIGAAAVASGCYALTPGSSINLSVENLNMINVLFSVGGESVVVIPFG